MKIALNRKMLRAVFITAEAVLCILVQLVGGALLSFSAVAVAFLYVINSPRRSFAYILGATALLFTVLADVCLVLSNPINQLLGMVFFNITQLFYFVLVLFLERSNTVRRVHHTVRLLSLFAVSIISAVILGTKTDALSVISVIYYTNLIVNIIFAFILTRGGGKVTRFLLPTGLLFFALCDLFVGFAEIAPYFTITVGTLLHFLANPTFNIAWLFYIPSQTILAVSITLNKES